MTDEENTTLITQTARSNNPGNLYFVVPGGQEALVFMADGRVLVRGEEVDNNLAIYEEVKAFFAHCASQQVENICRKVLSDIAESLEEATPSAAAHVRNVRDTKFPV
jgi:hypothetical protein